jgi:hypothetical protein
MHVSSIRKVEASIGDFALFENQNCASSVLDREKHVPEERESFANRVMET